MTRLHYTNKDMGTFGPPHILFSCKICSFFKLLIYSCIFHQFIFLSWHNEEAADSMKATQSAILQGIGWLTPVRLGYWSPSVTLTWGRSTGYPCLSHSSQLLSVDLWKRLWSQRHDSSESVVLLILDSTLFSTFLDLRIPYHQLQCMVLLHSSSRLCWRLCHQSEITAELSRASIRKHRKEQSHSFIGWGYKSKVRLPLPHPDSFPSSLTLWLPPLLPHPCPISLSL